MTDIRTIYEDDINTLYIGGYGGVAISTNN
jgi:hypothetical protein